MDLNQLDVFKLCFQNLLTILHLSLLSFVATIKLQLSSDCPPLRTKHLSIRALRLAEAIKEGTCTLGWVNTKVQKADYLTKPVIRAFQKACLRSLGMRHCKNGDSIEAK
eukprot:1779228-Amphidinium_carterae.1